MQRIVFHPKDELLFFQPANASDSYSVKVEHEKGITVTVLSGKQDTMEHADHFCQQLGDWGYLTGKKIPVKGYNTHGGNEVFEANMMYDGNNPQNQPAICALSTYQNNQSVFIYAFKSGTSQDLVAEITDKLKSMKDNPKLNIQSVEASLPQLRR